MQGTNIAYWFKDNKQHCGLFYMIYYIKLYSLKVLSSYWIKKIINGWSVRLGFHMPLLVMIVK